MLAPVQRLKKSEIIWLANNRCRHSHTFLEHFNCFLEESAHDRPKDMPLTYGFLDIETTGSFKAQWGRMLSWCIKDEGPEGKIHEDVITKAELQSYDRSDKRIVKSLIKKAKDYDVLVTYYGSRFDLPFVRTRAVMHGLTNPFKYGDNISLDLYYTVRKNFSLQGNSLKNACTALLGHTNKSEVTHEQWQRAALGDKKCLEYVLEHNRYDVIDTEELYHKVIPYRKRMDGSI